MSRTIPITDPRKAFDFDWEASTAAVNEACAGENVHCSVQALCQDCETLRIQIKNRLIRAFEAGRASGITTMKGTEDGNE